MCAPSARRRGRRPIPDAAARFARVLTADVLEQRPLVAVITPSTSRSTTNATGDIAIIGNTRMIAPASDPSAVNARDGVGSKTNNNDFNMNFVDVDQDFTTFETHAKGGAACPPIGGSDRRGATIGHSPVARSDLQHAAHLAVLSPGSLTVGGPFSRSSNTECCRPLLSGPRRTTPSSSKEGGPQRRPRVQQGHDQRHRQRPQPGRRHRQYRGRRRRSVQR